LEHHEVLRTLSEIARAFTGFSEIVAVLKGRSVSETKNSEHTGIAILLATSLGVVLFGFVPALLNAAFNSPPLAWRVSILLFATFHVAILIANARSIIRILRAGDRIRSDPRSIIPLFACGFLISGFQVATAVGLFEGWLFFGYLLGMIWLLGIATLMFCSLLFDGLGANPGA
jgi:hypothetical protein